jgi:hypothetical protein
VIRRCFSHSPAEPYPPAWRYRIERGLARRAVGDEGLG